MQSAAARGVTMTVAAGWSLAVTSIKISGGISEMNPFSSLKLFEQTDQKKVILNT
jgi:hypothetical protein